MTLPPKHQQLITELQLYLVRALNIKDTLLDTLKTGGLITKEQQDRLKNPFHDEATRTSELLGELEKKDEHMLRKFIQCLWNDNQTEIADRIEKAAKVLGIPEDQYKPPGIEAAPDVPIENPSGNSSDEKPSYIS